jgi:hypothetical protein
VVVASTRASLLAVLVLEGVSSSAVLLLVSGIVLIVGMLMLPVSVVFKGLAACIIFLWWLENGGLSWGSTSVE